MLENEREWGGRESFEECGDEVEGKRKLGFLREEMEEVEENILVVVVVVNRKNDGDALNITSSMGFDFG